MRPAWAALLLTVWLTCAALAQAPPQKFSAADRVNLQRAARTADRFVERFRRTLDFGTVWEEFRHENPLCTYETGLYSPDAFDFRPRGPLLRRLYVSSMNVYFLRAAYDLSLLRLADERVRREAAYTAQEIRAAFGKNRWFRPADDRGEVKLRSASDFEGLIGEMDALSRLYRKHMPREAMRTAAWRSNYRYLTHKDRDHLGVSDGDDTLCVPERTKVYVVDRGIFYFYLFEEGGRMRVAGFGLD